MLTSEQELQEQEYRLPIHWLLRGHGLVVYQKKTELMVSLIRRYIRQDGQALDIGCGDGRGTADLDSYLRGQFGFQGIDFSERAIAFARLMAPSIRFEVQNGHRLDFDDGSFALAVSREVIEHIPPPGLPDLIGEVSRVVKKDGLFLLTTPSKRRRVPGKHFQHFTVAELHGYLSKAEFRVLEVAGYGWWPPPAYERLYRRVIGLPAFWRIQAQLGSKVMPHNRADCFVAIGVR